ncbi:hypothetical protein CRG98_023478 [Punica granatum]|uniref:Uncharacterized protein n=1 Tax=Punica granatum TaxID=22663 RepID=A0A2I0JIN1_PUNGR|nr:hypothetical protein CRG98_023478 [Punica granatum]
MLTQLSACNIPCTQGHFRHFEGRNLVRRGPRKPFPKKHDRAVDPLHFKGTPTSIGGIGATARATRGGRRRYLHSRRRVREIPCGPGLSGGTREDCAYIQPFPISLSLFHGRIKREREFRAGKRLRYPSEVHSLPSSPSLCPAMFGAKPNIAGIRNGNGIAIQNSALTRSA